MFGFFRSKPNPPPPAPGAAVGYASELIDPKVMEQIGYLKCCRETVVDGLLAGKHRSTTKGGCCEFSQHRQYAPGDEIRQIDWQVFARNDRYFIKQFEEETNLHAVLALDTSGSMKFGLSTINKLDYARRAAACIARMLLRQRDAVGTAILNEQTPMFLPPKQNAAHLQAILSILSAAKPSSGGSCDSDPSHGAANASTRPVHSFSDCFGDLDELSTSLRIVRARGHDVVVMHVLAAGGNSFQFPTLVVVSVAGSSRTSNES